jgi:hypothetical protein
MQAGAEAAVHARLRVRGLRAADLRRTPLETAQPPGRRPTGRRLPDAASPLPDPAFISRRPTDCRKDFPLFNIYTSQDTFSLDLNYPPSVFIETTTADSW